MQPETRTVAAISVEEAVRVAREIFGLTVEAHNLPGEYDDNFHVQSPDGREFVLKVMHPDRERPLIEMQCEALLHLAKQSPQIDLPKVVPTKNGEAVVTVRAADGTERLVWMLTYVPGKTLVETKPHAKELLENLGEFLGMLDAGLTGFSHEAAHRDLKWNSSRTLWVREYLHLIGDSTRRAIVEHFLSLFEKEVVPRIGVLRKGVIYGDANDYNVLAGRERNGAPKIAGVIDFGDMHFGLIVSEVAIAAAYVGLGKTDPLQAAADVVAGYHRKFPLKEEEIASLFALMGARLSVSVVNSALRKTLKPDDAYVTVSEEPAWRALERMSEILPRFAYYTFREACGLEAAPQAKHVREFLQRETELAPIVEAMLHERESIVLDLSAGSRLLGANPENAQLDALTKIVFGAMWEAGARVGIGRYDEPRLLYASDHFGNKQDPTAEQRTIHLGIDLFVNAGTAVHAPLPGTVHAFANNLAALDYGPVAILRHETDEKREFFTLYGHLSAETLKTLRKGQRIARGEAFAEIGTEFENGGWPPHVHFQIIVDLLEGQSNGGTDFPGVAYASQREIWTNLSPDPNLVLKIPKEKFAEKSKSARKLSDERKNLLGGNLSVSYRKPLQIVRGWKQFLYDETGRAFLDVYNNVPLVGHSHPRVVEAVQEQVALLNTNTRYLHENVLRYAERLTALLPDPLRVCYFVNSGSEANELALRLAKVHTGREDVIVLEHAYHGHTNTLIDVSPYKFDGPGGRGKKPWVHVAPIADDYRGVYRRGDAAAGNKYAAQVGEIVERVKREGRSVGAFLAETLPSVAGQIVFPPEYLTEAYRYIRADGGVCIADEVQVGFGRLGTHFWGFETQNVVPDIVVFGKPIGNAFPLAAVVTTRAIADSFANGMEFFSTFGGNPVACAAGLAVLDVVRDEKLQENALRVGNYWIEALRKLQEQHALIGDVRGAGLFLGIDLVKARDSRSPATEQASYVVNRLREEGILAGTDGPHHNVIKLRPPLIFSENDADLFVRVLTEVLSEDAAQAELR